MTTAKLFQNGKSQAVRLPKEFRFEGDEVTIRKQGNRVILEPIRKTNKMSWKEFFETFPAIEGFMEDYEDLPPQERNLF